MKTIKTSLVVSCLTLPILAFSAETQITDPSVEHREESALQAAAHTTGSTVHPTSDAAAKQLALAKASQNPLATMVSLPFQSNINFNIGPNNQTQNVLNIQPVIPFELNDDWNIIQRTILPVTTQPTYFTGDGKKTGLGNTSVVAYLSPKASYHGINWGISPLLMLPASNTALGTKEWGYGISAVALTMPGKWLIGGLFNQVWAPSGNNSAQINLTSFQYFINYNLPDGWYISSAPTMNYNNRAEAGDRWTVPVGIGGGKVFHYGKQAMNISLRAYKTVVKPNANSSDWTLQTQFTLMFPK